MDYRIGSRSHALAHGVVTPLRAGWYSGLAKNQNIVHLGRGLYMRRRIFAAFPAILIPCVSLPAMSVTLLRFTPQGAVVRITQVQADFDGPAVALGDDGAANPYLIACSDSQAKGTGRWVDPQHWVYTFEQPLAGAVSCSAQPNPAFRDLQGRQLSGLGAYAFTTGGPIATLWAPWGERIDEDQVFVLRFNAPTDERSLAEHAHCEVQGLGEAVPIRLITGEQRMQILQSLGWDASEPGAADARLLQCKRRLPSDAQVRLVVGPGVASVPAPGQPTVMSKAILSRDFRVRKPFGASLRCTRTNAQAPCSPLFPVALDFSSAVPREWARRIVLQTPAGPVGPQELADEGQANQTAFDRLSFAPPFAERATLTLQVPDGLQDESGRPLSNAARFPLAVPMDAMPPLVKFASGPFGIIERFADGPAEQTQTAMVPLALRRVGPALHTRDLQVSAGQVSDHVTMDDARALGWFSKVQRLQEGRLTEEQWADVMALRPMREAPEKAALIDVRSRSMFTAGDDAHVLMLPDLKDMQGPDTELIGVPVPQPGLHVIEIASPRLGAALLAGGGGSGERPMYVRAAILVTNLAVHVKTGRDDMLVWVTSLDEGRPVADAQVTVLGCDGRRLRSGQTDARGLWHSLGPVPATQDCDGTRQSGVFVAAHVGADHPQAHGQADFSFAWSTWNQGIEPWRFNLPFSRSADPDWVAHAVMDRTLLHAGETLSMKLFLRALTRDGVRNPATVCGHRPACLPSTVQIMHEGSGDMQDLPVKWQTDASGGVYALLQDEIPPTAHLGRYTVLLTPPGATGIGEDTDGESADGHWAAPLDAGSFRVEAFKLPLLTGSLKISAPAGVAASTSSSDQPASPGGLVAPQRLTADVQLAWQSGGPARDLAVSVSAMAQPLAPEFDGYDDYTFGVPDGFEGADGQAASDSLRRLILDRQAVRLDARGGAQFSMAALPPVHSPQSWRFEASFPDPNGEIQTISQSAKIWPASVVVGLQAARWMSQSNRATVKLLVLDTTGHPQADVAVQLDGRVRTTYTTRKRLVGGFYAYDSHEQVAPLGTLCQGRTNPRGELSCTVALDKTGEIQLEARASDAQGRLSRAATSFWVWGGTSWSGGADDDRIDVIPSRNTYRPGETAEFTVRMPFRHAEALVAVEREGVLETHVVELSGAEPVIRVPVQPSWGPNVYVSVLAVRGRIRRVPWASFFEWGWKHPAAWAQARSAQVGDAPVPTGLVDLAKPSFRFGVAQIQVSSEADRLQVRVTTDRQTYHVRDKVRVKIHAVRPDGQPAASASVAFAAVDEALLALKENMSWDLLGAMRVDRDYGVETASAQGEVVGRRHYGRKAVPPGGGGGFTPTRELFDTLLLWRGDLTLDAQGDAQVEVPLNDSLTRFRLVAVVNDGQDRFGTGAADVVSTQDLQIVSGVPQIVREGDRYQAAITVRNRTQQPMALALSAQLAGAAGGGGALPAQELELAAGQSRRVSWPVVAPAPVAEQDTLTWTFDARTRNGPPASDRVVVHQTLQPAIPVTVRQATLVRLAEGQTQMVPAGVPVQALHDTAGVPRGGLAVVLQSGLAGTMPGVRAWLEAYPYTCLEQLTARAMGLQDPHAWNALIKQLPGYQTDSGLVAYFPGGTGSVILTAQLVELAAQARALGWPYAWPAPAYERMLAALQDYVFGRLKVAEWAPADDAFWRKLIAVNALTLAGAWQPGMLDSVDEDVGNWPTPAVVTWSSILQHVPGLPGRKALLARTDAILRTRLARHGTSLVVADTSGTDGWWLMSSVATAQARLLMAVISRPEWHDDVPRLLLGLLSLQSRGAWSTTTANVLGTLAVNQYAGAFEQQAGSGRVQVSLDGGAAGPGSAARQPPQTETLAWAEMPQSGGNHAETLSFPWPVTGRAHLRLSQVGAGGGWATVTARAAVAQSGPADAGMRLERTITAVSRARLDGWSVGDIYRVRLTIHSREPTVWSVISDPVPAGASILGGGLGRDSAIATAGESSSLPAWDRPSYVEHKAGLFRAYFEVMRAGTQVLEYTVRINAAGDFHLPPTRIEALYQPDVFGSLPNTVFHVEAQP